MKNIEQALTQYWGFNSFLPLQKEAMQCISSGTDSVVVLPTGGGKSLCFQAPALTMPGLALVVSPLISLMKDQVDALKECGVPAERLDSSLSPSEQQITLNRARNDELKLLYISPERLLSDGFLATLSNLKISFIAIDEAHCVSMWGHDFRPEYRQLGRLKDILDGITIAAYTATATDHVRQDIARQLKLNSPQMLTGSFDRPNLTYKVTPRKNIFAQICAVLNRHKGESGVIYCISRNNVNEMAARLKAQGYRAAPYHAGMEDEDRKKNQDLFITEKVDIIVATVAFGMGIDKSNVRFVLHSGMPKSLEHYQQESGRAGRDGLEAECCLFYSGGDYAIWKKLIADMPPEPHKVALEKLSDMYNFCTAATCRHQAILNYFGQELQSENCNACDICLGDLDFIDDALIIAQKILSCIVRAEQRFGGNYIAEVLTGSKDQRLLENQHDQLSTYGLLKEHPQRTVRDWIEQLTGQKYIEKYGDYNVLRVTPKGWQAMKGQTTPRLLKPTGKKNKISKVAATSWQGVDKELFEKLRQLRTRIAAEKGIPAYVVFGDTALRDMAYSKPESSETFLEIKGVGQRKCKQYAEIFIAAIKEYCQ